MVTLAEAVDAAAQLLGLTIIVAAFAAAAAFAYRWYVRERLPDGLAVLVGLSVVAISIGTTGWLNEVITGSDALLSATAALRNIGVFVICAGGAVAGARVGNHLSRTVAAATGSTVIDAEVSTLVEAVGRVISVELPEEIDDVVGYDPVSPRTKEALEGKTFLFPRRLTVGELRERLIARLRTDYAVGHVDLELAPDGTVEYLALGSRAAGIGPTLPPETAAVAIRADPAYAASAGDLVQVWETSPARRVLTAELRGTAEDVVTLAIDAADTPKLDPETRYRLVTLPVDDRPDREFASLLRAADETMATIEVGDDSPLAGRAVRDVGVSVAAITGTDGTTALPTGDRVLAPGEVLYAIGTPDALRKLEEQASGADGGAVRDSGGTTPPGAGSEVAGSPPEKSAPASPSDGIGESSGSDVSGGPNGEDAVEGGDDAGESPEDVPPVEPVREGYTPVFKPEGDRDPLLDKVPDAESAETETSPEDGVAEEKTVGGASEVDDGADTEGAGANTNCSDSNADNSSSNDDGDVSETDADIHQDRETAGAGDGAPEGDQG